MLEWEEDEDNYNKIEKKTTKINDYKQLVQIIYTNVFFYALLMNL